MDADEHVVLAGDLALDHRDVVLVVHQRAVPEDRELAEARRHARRDDPFDELVVAPAVGDQIGDRDQLQRVLVAVGLEIVEAGHRPVLVLDLADQTRGLAACEAREIDRGLGMTGALQDAPVPGLQRVDMTGHDDVGLGLRRVDGGPDRGGLVGGRDAGRDALTRFDGDRERGLVGRLVLERHELESELVAASGRQREADPAPGLTGHEVHGFRRGELRGHDEVALVLTVLVVDDDDHLPGRDVLERLLDGREGLLARLHRSHRPTSFSTYLATMSTSRFTGEPGASAPRVVRSRVSGIRLTENDSSSTAATVRETPLTAIDPFSTT